MSGDYLFVGPDLMTKYGAMLNEPADRAEEILTEYEGESDAVGERPWGHGDEMAGIFESNFVPAEQDFRDYVGILVDVLRETAVNTIYTAEQYRISDAGAEEFAYDLLKNMPDSPGGPDDLGNPGGLPGGNGRR
ncbi:hypothetical protein [Nocardiopsis aegyptia]|uniref:Uncharacterized protein n=1 Tax=Nocardiopsis aegyptia TaxID=220378 RepID=A0A7Z0JDV6_9ACTN|nr:hypothetical protein [Nocardiopsis aegyptia]NYJ37905.1 hypothetical protein [Nocardiopsis aegyptia]